MVFMMILKDKFVSSNDLMLWTQQLTPERTNDNCILISGAGAPAMFWTDEFCKKLTDAGYSVIRFDHRDQGLSDAVDWDKNPYTIEDIAKDVINILNAYNIDKAHIVGHSMGGIVAQWLALTYPRRVSSYTSMSVATCGITGQPPKKVMDVLLENKPTQNLENDLSGFMRSWKVLNGNYDIDVEIAKKYTEDFYIRSKHPVGVAWQHIWCQQNYIDLREKLNQITVPGLFVHGEQDPLIPVKGAIETQKITPHSRLLIIPDMGHMIFNKELEEKIAGSLIAHFKR